MFRDDSRKEESSKVGLSSLQVGQKDSLVVVQETEQREETFLDVDLGKREEAIRTGLPSARGQQSKFRTIEDAPSEQEENKEAEVAGIKSIFYKEGDSVGTIEDIDGKEEMEAQVQHEVGPVGETIDPTPEAEVEQSRR